MSDATIKSFAEAVQICRSEMSSSGSEWAMYNDVVVPNMHVNARKFRNYTYTHYEQEGIVSSRVSSRSETVQRISKGESSLMEAIDVGLKSGSYGLTSKNVDLPFVEPTSYFGTNVSVYSTGTLRPVTQPNGYGTVIFTERIQASPMYVIVFLDPYKLSLALATGKKKRCKGFLFHNETFVMPNFLVRENVSYQVIAMPVNSLLVLAPNVVYSLVCTSETVVFETNFVFDIFKPVLANPCNCSKQKLSVTGCWECGQSVSDMDQHVLLNHRICWCCNVKFDTSEQLNEHYSARFNNRKKPVANVEEVASIMEQEGIRQLKVDQPQINSPVPTQEVKKKAQKKVAFEEQLNFEPMSPTQSITQTMKPPKKPSKKNVDITKKERPKKKNVKSSNKPAFAPVLPEGVAVVAETIPDCWDN